MAGGHSGVAARGGLMLALLPALGSPARVRQAWLKWAGPEPLTVERSTLGPADGGGLEDAFGLAPGTSMDAPASLSFAEVRPRPEPAPWTLNGLTVEPADPSPGLTVLWLSLIVPGDEVHFVAAIVNDGPRPLALPDLVWESRLSIDGSQFAFADPGRWDGRAMIDAGGAAVLRLRFDHFDAPIPDRKAVMTFHCAPWTSPETEVDWRHCHD